MGDRKTKPTTAEERAEMRRQVGDARACGEGDALFRLVDVQRLLDDADEAAHVTGAARAFLAQIEARDEDEVRDALVIALRAYEGRG